MHDVAESRPTTTESPQKVRMRVLIADDEPTLRASCASVLEGLHYQVETAARGDEAREMLQRKRYDIALLDLQMPGIPGMELLQICRENHSEMLPIIMTGHANVEAGIEATRAGAWDFLPKPFTATQLEVLLGRASYEVRERGAGAKAPSRPNRPMRAADDAARSPDLPMVLGKSPVFLQAIRLAEQVAKTDASVFLTGESGAGKEIIAQFIHAHSRRNRKKMVAVNCAALPETLLESEMFGHCRGAFTGAVRDKPGLLEVADGGTFFLDELTEMSLPIQAKLLRVLQDGVVRRVGSEKEDARVDVRFIAATNRAPRDATEEGVLRRDLFYRLSVVPIRVPSLRERVDDIPLLAEHFLRVYWAKHRNDDEPLPTFSKAALHALIEREWRGNVRELQNVVEHAVVVLRAGSEIEPGDIPYLDEANGPTDLLSHGARWTQGLGLAEVDYHTARDRVTAEFELQYLREIMSRSGSNMSRAAKVAGIDRTTLYRLFQKHGLHRDSEIKLG